MSRSFKLSLDDMDRMGVQVRKGRCPCERCASGRRHQDSRARDAADRDLQDYDTGEG